MLAVMLPSPEESRVFRIEMSEEKHVAIRGCRFIVGSIGKPLALTFIRQDLGHDQLLEAFRQVGITEAIEVTYCRSQNPRDAGSLAVARDIQGTDGILHRTTEELSNRLLTSSQAVLREVDWGRTFTPRAEFAVLSQPQDPGVAPPGAGFPTFEFWDNLVPFSLQTVGMSFEKAILAVITYESPPQDARSRIGMALAAASIVSMPLGLPTAKQNM